MPFVLTIFGYRCFGRNLKSYFFRAYGYLKNRIRVIRNYLQFMAKNPTTRNACFTSFNVDKLAGLKENLDPNLVDYCVWQVERCPETDRLHIQGYLELKKPARFTGIKKILGDQSVHIEPRRGTRSEARDYCRKNESRVEGPYEFGTWREQTQGKRSDLDSVYDRVS